MRLPFVLRGLRFCHMLPSDSGFSAFGCRYGNAVDLPKVVEVGAFGSQLVEEIGLLYVSHPHLQTQHMLQTCHACKMQSCAALHALYCRHGSSSSKLASSLCCTLFLQGLDGHSVCSWLEPWILEECARWKFWFHPHNFDRFKLENKRFQIKQKNNFDWSRV